MGCSCDVRDGVEFSYVGTGKIVSLDDWKTVP